MLSLSTVGQKGAPVSVSLNKSALLEALSSHPTLGFPENAKLAVAVYKSTLGNQRVYVEFDLAAASPQGQFVTSATSADEFTIDRLVTYDHDHGHHAILRADLPSGLDISFQS